MGSRKRADMDFESRAISARVTKQIVTIFSNTCDNFFYIFTSENIKYTIYFINIFLYFTTLYIIKYIYVKYSNNRPPSVNIFKRLLPYFT